MKQIIKIIVFFLIMCDALYSKDVIWTPETPYNYDRRKSSTIDNSTSWSAIPGAEKCEYRLLLLMQAHKSSKALLDSIKKTGEYQKLSESEKILAEESLSDLDEALEISYREVITFFKKKENPTLLLMMLYHYNAYIDSGLAQWPSVIKELRNFDKKISQKANSLALPHE